MMLRYDILKLNSQIEEAKLELEYLTSPENIKVLFKTYLDEDFKYYDVSDIKKLNFSDYNMRRKKNYILPGPKTFYFEDYNYIEDISKSSNDKINISFNTKSFIQRKF